MPLVIWCVGDCIDSVDCIWYYSNFKYWFFLPRNMEYSPSVYVIFDFFHQCLIIFFVQFFCLLQFSSVQFSRSDMSSSLRPHESQHARPPCPSPTPGVHPNPCPLCRWCHPTISSSVIPFSCLQSFPASGFSFNISPTNEHPGLISFRGDWLDLINCCTLVCTPPSPGCRWVDSHGHLTQSQLSAGWPARALCYSLTQDFLPKVV